MNAFLIDMQRIIFYRLTISLILQILSLYFSTVVFFQDLNLWTRSRNNMTMRILAKEPNQAGKILTASELAKKFWFVNLK